MLDRFTWFKQSAYLWRGDGMALYIDPWGVTTDDPADVVLITHAHGDHLSMEDIEKIRREGTKFVAPHDVAQGLSGDVTPIRPGDSIEVAGLKVQAVPAYNVVEERLEAHPKANQWVGYLLSLGDHTYYHAGDTDDLEELHGIRTDVAFVPIGGGGFVMEVPEAADLVKAMSPGLAVPMHYGFYEGVGVPEDGERFAKEADPVEVRILEPQNPFTNR